MESLKREACSQRLVDLFHCAWRESPKGANEACFIDTAKLIALNNTVFAQPALSPWHWNIHRVPPWDILRSGDGSNDRDGRVAIPDVILNDNAGSRLLRFAANAGVEIDL